MKKQLLAVLLFCIFIAIPRVQAVVHIISVGNTLFTPDNLTMQIGDTIMWMWFNGSHTTTSDHIPEDALPWNAPLDQSNPMFEYVPSQPGEYTYFCTPHQFSGMVGSFTVNPPAVTANAGPDKIICSGSSAQIGSAPEPNVNYSWSPSTGLSNSNISNPVASPTVTTSYIVTADDGITNDVDTVVVTVGSGSGTVAKPGIVTQSGGAVKVCPGETRTYTIPPVANATTYVWTPPTGASVISGQGTTSAVLSFGAAFPASAYISVVAMNGCVSSQPRTKLITTGPAPARPSAITGNNAGVCNSTQAYSVTNVTGIDYMWDFNTAGASIGSGQSTNSIQATFASPFLSGTLSVSAMNGCGMSTERTLLVKALPAKPISLTGPTSVCPGSTIAYSTPAIYGATSYTWKAPAGSTITAGSNSGTTTLTTTANSVNITFSANAGSVRVAGNNACGSGVTLTTAITHNCGAKSGNSIQAHSLALAPNPASDALNISFSASCESEYSIIVVNTTGQKVAEVKAFSTNGANQKELDITSLSPGLYFVTISGSYIDFKAKFLKL